MKTIDKKKLVQKSAPKKEIKKYLVENPYGHHLLSSNSLTKKLSILAELIQLKVWRDTQNKSASLLISSISLCLSFLLVIGIFEWKIKENGSSVKMELRD